MKALLSNLNTDPASGDYPKGNTRDKAGDVAGTTVNNNLMQDLIQFFQKLVIDAGITENGLFDNVTNGYQLIEALDSRIKDNSAFTQLTAPANTDYTIDTTNAFIRTNNKGVTEFKGYITVTQNVAIPFVTIFTIPTANRSSRDIGVPIMKQNAPVTLAIGALITNATGDCTIAGESGTNIYYLDGIRFVK